MNNPNSLFYSVKQDKAPEILKLIVEISKGDINKYEYNKDLGVLELDRVLYGPTFYPVNYCDVPNTWNSGDNDPLDAVVFSTTPIVPGVLVKGRVVGVMEMIDNGESDYKIICVNDKDPRYKHVKTVEDLTEKLSNKFLSFYDINNDRNIYLFNSIEIASATDTTGGKIVFYCKQIIKNYSGNPDAGFVVGNG
jgi:inorganic pyrophosphatase